MIILDSNVISELMRPKPSHSVELWFASARGLLVATTVISITEVKFGLFRLPPGVRRKSLEQAFEDLERSAFSLHCTRNWRSSFGNRWAQTCRSGGRLWSIGLRRCARRLCAAVS